MNKLRTYVIGTDFVGAVTCAVKNHLRLGGTFPRAVIVHDLQEVKIDRATQMTIVILTVSPPGIHELPVRVQPNVVASGMFGLDINPATEPESASVQE